MSKRESDKAEIDALTASVAKAVCSHREAAGLGMAELAKNAGMARAYIWRVEKAETLPTLRNLARMASALDMTLSEFLKPVDIVNIELKNRPYDNKD